MAMLFLLYKSMVFCLFVYWFGLFQKKNLKRNKWNENEMDMKWNVKGQTMKMKIQNGNEKWNESESENENANSERPKKSYTLNFQHT